MARADWKKKGNFYINQSKGKIIHMRTKYSVNKAVGWEVVLSKNLRDDKILEVVKTVPQGTKVIKKYMEKN